MFVSFITRVCKYLDHRGPVGGATLAHWSGEKGGVYLSGSRHLHTRFSLSLDERLGGRFRRLLGDDRQQEEEEGGEAMFCGWRKMAGGAMLARE